MISSDLDRPKFHKTIRDSAEHLVAHELLERDVRSLRKTVETSIGALADSVSSVVDGVGEIKRELAVTCEKMRHLATDADISAAISRCQIVHKPQPTNWKMLTTLITATIAAIATAVVSIVQGFR